MRSCWVVLLAVGCYRPNDLACGTVCGQGGACPSGLTCDTNGLCKPTGMAGDCPTPDADIDAFVFEDAPADAPLSGQAVCWGNMGDFFRTCIDPAPTSTYMPTGVVTIDTTTCESSGGYVQTQAQPPGVCVIAAQTIVINPGVTVRAVGNKPLALFATTSFTLGGTIDVAGHGPERGAGGNTGGDCVAIDGGSPGGGGAGGSLALPGGAGGRSDAGGAGAGLAQTVTIDRVRGGCNGGAGAKGVGFGGPGGRGGGAVYLLTRGTLTMAPSAIINASGGGAAGGGRSAGGGGGGAGGFIGIHANSYVIDGTSKAFAIGGGGGSGGNLQAGGNPGMEATGAMSTTPAPGVGDSGPGGSGTSAKGADGGNASGASENGAGGGGGGAGGRIGFEGQMPVVGSDWKPSPVQL